MGFFSWLFGPSQREVSAPYRVPERRILPRKLVWQASGEYEYEIVGESHHQDALDTICGGKTDDGHAHECRAVLVPEPNNPYDRNAVAIHIQSRKVGHLSREDAASYNDTLRSLGISGKEVECDAIILGGWDRKGRGSGHYGVKLDLDLPLQLE